MEDEKHPDTEPPVSGSKEIPSGSSEYDMVLLDHCFPVKQDDQYARTETFTVKLLDILAGHGVRDIHRLMLGSGAGGRDTLSITLQLDDDQLLSYNITMPLGSDPFTDPGWVAAELIRQSSTVRQSLRPDSP